MDIEYLLALQQLRAQLGDPVETFMLVFSYVADGPALVALALIIYWCIDKRIGLFAIGSMATGTFVSQHLKNILCVYRPWIRDPRIIPSTGAIDGAAGYSFPSGHVTGATTTFGAIGWLCRKKHKVIAVLCLLAILVIAFSRNYLGVHTPQDVIVAFLISIIMIALVNKYLSWIERCDAMTPGHNKDLVTTIIVEVVCIASIAIIAFKSYPMDYVNGALLVDPVEMQKGSFEAVGMLGGVTLGWLLERRFVGFETGSDVGMAERVVRGIVGVGFVGITYIGTDIAFDLIMPHIWAKLCGYFILTVIAMFVAPLAFKLLQRFFRPEKKKRGAHAQ